MISYLIASLQPPWNNLGASLEPTQKHKFVISQLIRTFALSTANPPTPKHTTYEKNTNG